MGKNCIYCKSFLSDDCVIDVCDVCGRQVWGDKMFSAIKTNMENAREEGSLNQGSVTESLSVDKEMEF